MTDHDDNVSKKYGGEGRVVRFPQSRVRPSRSEGPFKQLGPSQLAMQFGAPGRQAMGHRCSRCCGIWYGYLLEVACPVCGNRHG